MKPAISDTDILSAFGKIGRADLLQRLFQKIYAAPAVYRELMKRVCHALGLPYLDLEGDPAGHKAQQGHHP